MITTLRPNVDTPLLPLLESPRRFDELGVYSYVFHNDREPNTFGRLRKNGFWAHIGKPVVVETGALNEHEPTNIDHFIRESVKQHELLGACMKGVQVDETLFKLGRIGVPSTEIVQRVLPYFDALAHRGLEVHVIEPVPAMSVGDIQRYVSRLRRRVEVQRVILDFDLDRWGREAPAWRWWQKLLGWEDPAIAYREVWRAQMGEFRRYLESASIEFGVILGSPFTSERDQTENNFYLHAMDQWKLLSQFKPDVVTVQSWEPPLRLSKGGQQNWPSLHTLNKIIGAVT